MRTVDLIEKKKNKISLTKDEINFLIEGYTDGSVPDYQMAAFAMAVVLNGMNPEEISALTLAMMNSGETFDLSDLPGIKIDKHSTGGIGDKTSLALCPILAACGATVAKMSGRGLGFTGGTLDKLESIPGFKVEQSEENFKKIVSEIGTAIISQTKNIVPADKKLYALRDVTGTVASIPLIAASIMSKKLATGSDAILLDIKTGDGAFMKTFEEAKTLGETMISIGQLLGRDVKVEITNMDRPLGRAIGNRNEVIEAIETLKGNGPEDFNELLISSGSVLLEQAKIAKGEEAKVMIQKVISDGSALEKFKKMVQLQGGDWEATQKEDFINVKYTHEIKAEKDGFFEVASSVGVGIAAMKIGAGRETKEDDIDFSAGIYLNKKTNEKVSEGDVVITMYSNNEIPNKIIEDVKNSIKINEKTIENKIILGKLK